MREKLVVLIIRSVNGCARNWAETIANYLLANGVVVLPYKVGDMVWVVYDGYAAAAKIIAVYFDGLGGMYDLQIFTTEQDSLGSKKCIHGITHSMIAFQHVKKQKKH